MLDKGNVAAMHARCFAAKAALPDALLRKAQYERVLFELARTPARNTRQRKVPRLALPSQARFRLARDDR